MKMAVLMEKSKRYNDEYYFTDRSSENKQENSNLQIRKEICQTPKSVKCYYPTGEFPLEFYFRSWCTISPRRIQNLRLQESINLYLQELPPVIILGKNNLTNFAFGKNGIKYFTGPIILNKPQTKQPISVDLSSNVMECISPNLFDYTIDRGLIIGELILRNNSLNIQIQRDRGGLIFKKYEKLTKLDLFNNRITFLPRKIFHSLINLEELNLAKNSLQSITFELFRLKKLRLLDLAFNLIVVIDINSQKILTQISSLNSLRVSLRANPYQCNCESLQFLNWLVTNSELVGLKKGFQCMVYNSGTPTNFNISTLKKKLTKLNYRCNIDLPIKIAGGLVALLMVCLLIGTIVYKYRWDIRYFIIKLSQSHMRYQILLEENNDYVFDAFVSYDKDDRRWVVDELIANLETFEKNNSNSVHVEDVSGDPLVCGSQNLIIDGGTTQPVENPTDESQAIQVIDKEKLHLCIHERDFEVGKEIETNILDAIETSRKVILVVTKNFIRSKWCRLELEMAKCESLERGRNLVVTILLEPIEETLDSLVWITKRYTYLEWFSYQEHNRSEFWKRLRIALSNTKMEKFVCECGKEYFSR